MRRMLGLILLFGLLFLFGCIGSGLDSECVCPPCDNATNISGACCHPKISYVNESGVFPVDCLDSLSEYKCGLLQGTFFEGSACANLSQEQCPKNTTTPPASSGSCCHPKISYVNESGVFPVQCLDGLSEYKCGLLQGTYNTGTACDELGALCPALGSCCYPNGTVNSCKNSVVQANCTSLGGTFHANRMCANLSETECPVDIKGACCDPKISYVNESGVFPVDCLDNLSANKCGLLAGTWFASATCDSLTATQCPAKAIPLPDPTGACCKPKISYVNESGVFPVQCLDSLTQYKCGLLQGSWFEGEGCSNLSQVQCPPIDPAGACCVYDEKSSSSTCHDWRLASECKSMDGNFYQSKKCSDLTDAQCPKIDPKGACCNPKISYVNESGVFPVKCLDDLAESKCDALAGSWFEGKGCSDLGESQCPTLGACCYISSPAAQIYSCKSSATSAECKALGGSFYADKACSGLSPNECPIR